MRKLSIQVKPSHFGMYVKDLTVMEDFYVNSIGFLVTDRWKLNDSEMVFLSKDPQEHHQLVLATGRQEGQPSQFNQISYEVSSLRSLHSSFNEIQGITKGIVSAMNHGGSWSIYFPDPEDNTIELFAYTETYAPPIATVPMDMTLPFDLLIEQTNQIESNQ